MYTVRKKAGCEYQRGKKVLQKSALIVKWASRHYYSIIYRSKAFWTGQTVSVDSKPSACLDTIRKKRRKKQRGKHKLSFLCWLPNQRDCSMDHLSPFGRPELIRASVKSYRQMRKTGWKEFNKITRRASTFCLADRSPRSVLLPLWKKSLNRSETSWTKRVAKKEEKIEVTNSHQVTTTKLAVIYYTSPEVTYFFGREII